MRCTRIGRVSLFLSEAGRLTGETVGLFTGGGFANYFLLQEPKGWRCSMKKLYQLRELPVHASFSFELIF